MTLSNDRTPLTNRFITTFTTNFADAVLINALTRNITSLNQTGNAYLQLNTSILYHNLLNIDPAGNLPQTFALLRLFGQGPSATTAATHQRVAGLTNGQLRKLLVLQFSARLQSKNRDEVMAADTELQERLTQFGTEQ